jgi:hypothetical protein
LSTLIEDVVRSTGATTVYTHGQKDSHQTIERWR